MQNVQIFKKISVCAVAFLALVAPLATLEAQREGRSNRINQSTFAKCMEAVVLGQRSAKKLKFGAHEFNCNPLSRWRTDEYGSTIVTGTISHHRSLRADRQVRYRFAISAKGELSGLRITDVGRTRLNPGQSVHHTFETTQSTFAAANEEFGSDWKSAARATIVALAANLAHSRYAAYRNELTSRRRASTRYYNVAPRSTGPARLQIASDPAGCEAICRAEDSCEAWSFMMQKSSRSGQRLEPVCRVFSKSSYQGYVYREHAITAKIRRSRRGR